jgi:hypothetical protein
VYTQIRSTFRHGIWRTATVLSVAMVSIDGPSCRAVGEPPHTETVWERLGTWSGHGRRQTESFNSLIGTLRITWKATHAVSDGGSFKLTLLSAISGRRMGIPVEHSGDGGGTAMFADTPHMFFAVIDSDDLDWTFTVEEPVKVVITPK